MPFVGTRSLCAIGSPNSGPGRSPRASRASFSCASSSARSAVSVMIALTVGLTRSICARCARRTSVTETSRWRMRCASSTAVRKHRSLMAPDLTPGPAPWSTELKWWADRADAAHSCGASASAPPFAIRALQLVSRFGPRTRAWRRRLWHDVCYVRRRAAPRRPPALSAVALVTALFYVVRRVDAERGGCGERHSGSDLRHGAGHAGAGVAKRDRPAARGRRDGHGDGARGDRQSARWRVARRRANGSAHALVARACAPHGARWVLAARRRSVSGRRAAAAARVRPGDPWLLNRA